MVPFISEQLLHLPKIPGSEELHTNPLLYHGISVPQRTYSYPLMVWFEISPLGFCFENQWLLIAQFWWLWSLTGRSGVSLWRLFLPLILLFFLCLLFRYDMKRPLIYSHCHRTSSTCHPQLWQTKIPLKWGVQRKLSSHFYQIFYYSDKNLTIAHLCDDRVFEREWSFLRLVYQLDDIRPVPWIMIRSICQQNPKSDGTHILLRP